MHNRVFSILAYLGLWAATPASIHGLETSKHPNIIFVLIDDMGWGDLSCFGNTDASTPNIDELAAEGVRFESFYVNSPICSPSRTAFLTGQYPQRWNIHSYLNNREDNERRGMASWLDVKAPSVARVLKSAGYATGHFGKWHMGGQRDVGEAPLISEYGFDESLTNFEGLGPRLLGLGDAYDGKPVRRHSLRSDELGRGPIIWMERGKLTEGYAQAAIHFMDHAQKEKRPFFINLWPDDVHSPFFPPKAKRGDQSKRALYLGVLETMDAQLGKLFKHVKENPALNSNTLIVLCSDNGHEPGAGRGSDLRGSKATLYEGGVRSPLIVWGPGLMREQAQGSVNRESVFSVIDVATSLLNIGGAEGDRSMDMDGEDLSAVLLGESKSSRTKPLFWRRPPDRKTMKPSKELLPDLAVREGGWKLLCEYDGSKEQLYQLKNDPGESENVAAEQPEIVKRLKALLLAWHQQMPQDRGAEIAVEQSK